MNIARINGDGANFCAILVPEEFLKSVSKKIHIVSKMVHLFKIIKQIFVGHKFFIGMIFAIYFLYIV